MRYHFIAYMPGIGKAIPVSAAEVRVGLAPYVRDTRRALRLIQQGAVIASTECAYASARMWYQRHRSK